MENNTKTTNRLTSQLDEAKLELVKHGFKPVNRADMLMVEGYQDEPNEFVATVFRDGDVQTSQVMKWLGY